MFHVPPLGGGEAGPLQLWESQKTFIRDYLHVYQYLAVLKARQMGFTTMIALDTFIQASLIPGYLAGWVSKSEEASVEALAKIKRTLARSPLETRSLFACEAGVTKISFPNGSEIHAHSTKGGRSFSYHRAIIDEAGEMNGSDCVDLQEILAAMIPTLSQTGGQAIVLGTNKPNATTFKRLILDAKKQASIFRLFFFSCHDQPGFDDAARERKLLELGGDRDTLNREYPRTVEEALMGSSAQRFAQDALRWYEENGQAKCIVRGNIDSTGRVEKRDDGNMSFYRRFYPGNSYIIAADVAEGLEHGDYSCAKIFDSITEELVAEWHGHIEHAEFGSILAIIGRRYTNAYIVVEANNHGVATLERLITTEEYPQELIHVSNYAKEKGDDAYRAPQKRFGFLTTSKMKRLIIDQLAQDLNQHAIPSLTEDDISEMRTYVRDERGNTNAETGCYDDRVMAMAIGRYVMRFVEKKERRSEFQSCDRCQYYTENADSGMPACTYSKRHCAGDDWCAAFRLRPTFAEVLQRELTGKGRRVR
jgi:hypothetical protein